MAVSEVGEVASVGEVVREAVGSEGEGLAVLKGEVEMAESSEAAARDNRSRRDRRRVHHGTVC